jgi:pyridoxine 5-phosphate synthase
MSTKERRIPRLTVNVDHVATVRQARRDIEPDPVSAAMMVELAGADGITVHLREDRRHIQDRDVMLLRKLVKTELNLEMATTEEMRGIALELKPDLITLVPEKRVELTTEGGLDVKGKADSLKSFIATLKDGDIPVNLFIDPLPDAVKMSHRVGASGVELHTGCFAEAKNSRERAKEFKRLADSAVLAKRLKLKVHAGHGLDYRNIKDVLAIREIEEFAIGFSIIARSLYVGIDKAVREMLDILKD